MRILQSLAAYGTMDSTYYDFKSQTTCNPERIGQIYVPYVSLSFEPATLHRVFLCAFWTTIVTDLKGSWRCSWELVCKDSGIATSIFPNSYVSIRCEIFLAHIFLSLSHEVYRLSWAPRADWRYLTLLEARSVILWSQGTGSKTFSRASFDVLWHWCKVLRRIWRASVADTMQENLQECSQENSGSYP